MKKTTGRLWVAGGLALMLAAPAAAAPAVDVEVELRYWANEVTIETTGSPDDSADAPGIGLRAEVVLIDRLAIAGEYHDLSGEDELDGTDFTQLQLDAKWRLIAPTENTFFALGLGYEEFEVDEGGATFSTDGLRIVADGRIGFAGLLYGYGRLAYLPSLGDLTVQGQTYAEGDTAFDLDLGVGIEPLPLLTLWVGYRTESFEFKEPGGSAELMLDNSGFYVGAGIRF